MGDLPIGSFLSLGYSGYTIPRDEVCLGAVFYAHNLGFGLIYKCFPNGIAQALTASGQVLFHYNTDTGFYTCFPVLYRKGCAVDEVSGLKHANLCFAVLRITFVCVLSLDLGDGERFIKDAISPSVAKSLLSKFICEYEREYRPSVRTRRALEYIYNMHRDTSSMTGTEKSFNPVHCECICTEFDRGLTTLLYRQRYGRFFLCRVNAEFDSTAVFLDASSRLTSVACDSTSVSAPNYKYKCNSVSVQHLSEEDAEKYLRDAVIAGVASSFVYEKYFGEYADSRSQIAVRIPVALRNKIAVLGLTIEELIERGCEAYISDLGKDFEGVSV